MQKAKQPGTTGLVLTAEEDAFGQVVAVAITRSDHEIDPDFVPDDKVGWITGFEPGDEEIGRILVLYDPDKDHLHAEAVDLVVWLPKPIESIRLGPYVLTRRDAIVLARLLLEAEQYRYDDELETAECEPDPDSDLPREVSSHA